MKRTARFWTFLVASLIFWFFANQTQVGWLYVVSALLGGVLFAGYLLNFGTVKQVAITRHLKQDVGEALHEGDTLAIELTLDNRGQLPASQLALIETCPLTDPTSEDYHLRMYIPTLAHSLKFEYQTIVYRRGLHHFPTIKMTSRAPFGFYERRGEKKVETSVLVYPELRKLSRLSLLDEQPAAELTNPKAGIGSEVIGVRPYRAGDSPRHIHWRSVARRGQLVSKEFSQETQPGVSIVLDRYCPLIRVPESKHQPFEIAIKSVVSIAEYAMRQGYPVHLSADTEGMAVPQGAIVWDALMQYTARVFLSPKANLANVLNYQPLQQFVAIALAWLDESVIETLLSLAHRGYNLLVIVPDPSSFPIDSSQSADNFIGTLEHNGITTRLIQHEQDWATIISNEQE